MIHNPACPPPSRPSSDVRALASSRRSSGRRSVALRNLRSLLDRRLRIVLPAIALSGMLLRLAVRLYSGSADLWRNGYAFYFELARNIAAGSGLAFDGEPPTAFRVPIYPMFLAAVTLGHKAFLAVVFAQSLIGAATVL